VSEIQSVEGRPLKKGLSPGRRSAFWALGLLVAAIVIVVVGQLVQPPGIPTDHDLGIIQADGRVALARGDGSAPVPLTGVGVPGDATGMQMAPGGDFVALRTPAAIVVVDRAGVVSWRKAVVGASVTFAWSPDGSRVAIFDSGGGLSSTGAPRASLQVLTSAGALEWDVPLADGFGGVPGYGNLAWSPDGGSLAFSGFTRPGLLGGLQPTALWKAAVDAQTLATFGDATLTNTFVYGPAWASDGKLYFARSSFEQSGIWQIDPSSGDATLLLRRQMDSCAAGATCTFELLGPLIPSPDASTLAFRDVTRDLSILVIATRAITVVPGTQGLASTPYEWAADGRSLLYIAHADPPADPVVPRDLARFDPGSGSSAVLIADVRAFDVLAGTP
jgi:hypothetical protein